MKLPDQSHPLPTRLTVADWHDGVDHRGGCCDRASAFAFILWREKPGPRELVRFQIFAPHTANLPAATRSSHPTAASSPSGAWSGRPHSTVGSVPGFARFEAVAGTDGVANSSFWSPDSRFLGFVVQGKLKKVDTAGGPAQAVCDIPRALARDGGMEPATE